MKKCFSLLFLIYVAGLISSCTPTRFDSGNAPGETSSNICSSVQTESSECSSTLSVGSSPVTVTGTANFNKRSVNVSTSGSNVTDIVLGAPLSTALPIKYAEVQVLNASGTIVQCGTTNSAGALKAVDGTSDLQIPSSAGTYTVKVLSRSNKTLTNSYGNFKLYSSVKKSICTNEVHSIKSNITSTGTGPIAVIGLTAYARESESSSIEGGAFNIHNNLVATYEYLAANTNSNLSCLNPKLHVYWLAGFNPYQYINPTGDPSDESEVPALSFYYRGYNELYINGGRLGNVTSADTDHFDDAVIIHEIGHRLEDACGKSDSPGGTHYGQFRIDPRLAWSEGWGNFLGAHIIRNKIADINPEASTALTSYDGWLYYLDTQGYDEGSNLNGYELIRFNLAKAGNNPESLGSGYYFDKVDSTNHPGEGHFREVSVARALFKINNTCTATTCIDTSYFSEVWKAFEKDSSGIGMGKSAYPFRSSVRFYDRLNAVFVAASTTMPAAIDAVLNSDEAQQRSTDSAYTIGGNLTWPAYGIKLLPTTTPCNLEIRPKYEYTTVTYSESDQRYSNHFYYIDRTTSLTGISTITLNTTKVVGTTLNFGLGLFLEGYNFSNSPTYSTSLNVSGLTGSTYLLNVHALTDGVAVLDTTRYTYTLTTNNSGEYLCPTTF